MKVVKRLLFIFILLFSFEVKAFEDCTVTEDYKYYMSLTEEERSQYLEPIRCEEFYSGTKKSSVPTTIFTNLMASSLPNTYTSSYVTSVKNQYDLGTCWSFAAIAVVEANAKKNGLGEYDLSEEHVLYSLLSSGYSDAAGKKGKYNVSSFDGGKLTYASSYFYNGYGQLTEAEWPYVNEERVITSSEYKRGKKMLSVADYNIFNVNAKGPCTADEITNIKQAVYDYGAVQASMLMDKTLFPDAGKNYYLATTDHGPLPNHAITIVGWDDTINKSNFTGATRNGAFLIKNSWGPTWSSDGYFYISYDDNFICKNSVSYSGVSKTTYDYSYKSADMVGLPDFMFSNTFYVTAKFSKQSIINEELKRITIPTALNSKYTVYISRDNDLNNSLDWKVIGTGHTDNYGFKSIDLSNEIVTDDYTIIIKYDVDSGKQSTSLMMCNGRSETSKMDISSGVNFYSRNGSTWNDFKSVNIAGDYYGCEPTIFAYSNEVASDLAITNITVNVSTVTANVFLKSVNTNDVSIRITDSNNKDVTSKFTVTPKLGSNYISIVSDGKTSGTFKLNVTYNNYTKTKSFTLKEIVTSLDNNFIKIKSPNIFVTIGNNYLLNYANLVNKLSIKNTTYSVVNANGNVVSNSSYVGTNFRLLTNNNQYKIIVKGDVNGDGKISALDYIEIRKHIMGTKITDAGKKLASDMDDNNSITALDYIAIRKIIMR